MSINARRLDLPPRPRIAIFRALVLGDLLCAMPAWRAVRAAWPDAELTLVGLPWARELIERLSWIDRFIEFPGHPGLPERTPDLAALPGFFARMQAERFDLMLQMHGSGAIVNPMLAACGARHTAGFTTPDDWCADAALHVDWPQHRHEIDRMLALTDHLGLPRRGRALEFPLHDDDRLAARALGAWPERSYVCVHAGAQLPSRRWRPARFAALSRQLHDAGHQVVLTGTAGERALVDEVRRASGVPVLDLCGKTSLWTMGAVIEGARLLLCNDTGVSHIAAALATPSVVISSGADVQRWAPLDRQRHRMLWHDVPCRPCSFRECPYGHPCADAIGSAQVMRVADELLRPRVDAPADGSQEPAHDDRSVGAA